MKLASSLLTPLAGCLLAAPGIAQANSVYDYNWASLADGPPSLVVDPLLFGSDGDLGIGDAIRVCYSIDVTQGGRNQGGQSFLSAVSVTQAWGGANPIGGIDVGQVSFMSMVSSSLRDDACLSDLLDSPSSGTVGSIGAVNLGAFGLLPGTASFSLNEGIFWTVSFEFIGTTLVSIPNRGGEDPVSPFPTPLLAHLVYEVQGPATGGEDNRQYFLASTSERPGIDRLTGGATNGNVNFGENQYGVPARLSGAVQGNRLIAESNGSLEGAAPLVLLGGTNSEIEFLGALAFQTPYLTGVKNGNDGNGGSDWVVSSSPTSLINVRLTDKQAGAENITSGSEIANPNLILNHGYVLFSSTAAESMLQEPLSWDDMGGMAPPQPGTYSQNAFTVTRVATPQRLHVNVDGTTLAFQNLGIGRLSRFTDANFNGTGGSSGFFDTGVGTIMGGTASLANGPISLSQPSPSAKGSRIGMHAVGIQVDAATGAGLVLTEFSNARTVVLQ